MSQPQPRSQLPRQHVPDYGAPGPYVPPPEEPSARAHLTANVVLLCGMALLHLAGLGSVVINVILVFSKPTKGSLSNNPELIGNMIGFLICAIWVVAGLILAPTAAWGLGTRQAWGRRIAQIYWGVSIAACCCWPAGVYGLWSLSRDDVKRALG